MTARLSLSPEAPKGVPALRSVFLWMAIALGALTGAMVIVVNGSVPVALRIMVDIALFLVSTAALMLASDGIARLLNGRFSDWDRILQWFTTSVVALAVVVLLGAPITSLAPDTPSVSSLAVDVYIDLLLGLIGGLVDPVFVIDP